MQKTRGWWLAWVCAAVVAMGCGESPPAPADAGAIPDAGPTNFTCAPFAFGCTGLDPSVCVSLAGCGLDGQCSGSPLSCYSFDNIADCQSQTGCRWEGLYCEPTPSRSCAGVSFGRCEENGCSLDSTWCVEVPSACAAQPFDVCEATPACAVVCDPGLVPCARGCVPEEEAVGDPSCVRDCAGTLGGSAARDECGVCDDDPTNNCENDCAGVPHGDATVDQCGTCDADPTNDCRLDCNFVWGGPARDDRCGECDDDPTNDCVEDCNGVWGGFGVLVDGICSSSSPGWCTGEWLFGRCWFLGGLGSSCTNTCSYRGFAYDPATEQVTGSRGATEDCTTVLNALGIAGTAFRYTGVGSQRAFIGCAADRWSEDPVSYTLHQYAGGLTTGDASYAGYQRTCACE